MKKLSDAAHRLEGQRMFQILAVARELERQGKEILHFELGDPDFDTPKNIVQAAIESLKNGETHYAPSSGLLEFKKAAADVTLRSRGFKPDLDQLLVCPGANVQIYYAAACAVNPREEVIVPDPGFVSYFSILKFLGIKIVRVPLYERNEFRLNPDDVQKAITDKTRMIIMNSPSNPTGAVMTEDEVRRMYEIAKEYDVYLLSDEIYARMLYRDANTSHHSPSKFDQCKERTIVVNGFSKSYAMTGWRLGVVTGPAELINKMGLLLETTTSCVSPFIQKAGIEALKGSQEPIINMVDEFRERRDVMVEGLNSLPGITCLRPKGAFYVFPNVTKTGLTSDEFADVMLNQAGVALAPGTIFGEYAQGYARLCYANSIENIKKAIEEMGKVLEARQLS
ncbi:MAG: pyridoxal phosphate-dependent aminotransferase [Candidatus Brocadia sp.]|nr:pyridoxal phosphate-dependent aminotransferase [Candidatus Brocadia sp.]